MPPEQIARDIERRRLCIARTQHNGDQLGVGEGMRAVSEQALARTFAGRPVGDARHRIASRSVRALFPPLCAPALLDSRQFALSRATLRDFRQRLDSRETTVDVLDLAIDLDDTRRPLLDAGPRVAQLFLDDLDARETIENFRDDAHAALRVLRRPPESCANDSSSRSLTRSRSSAISFNCRSA